MLKLIRRSSNYLIKRHLHDRKLPSVKLSKKTNTKLIGTESPRKADNQINKTSKDISKTNKLKKN